MTNKVKGKVRLLIEQKSNAIGIFKSMPPAGYVASTMNSMLEGRM